MCVVLTGCKYVSLLAEHTEKQICEPSLSSCLHSLGFEARNSVTDGVCLQQQMQRTSCTGGRLKQKFLETMLSSGEGDEMTQHARLVFLSTLIMDAPRNSSPSMPPIFHFPKVSYLCHQSRSVSVTFKFLLSSQLLRIDPFQVQNFPNSKGQYLYSLLYSSSIF